MRSVERDAGEILARLTSRIGPVRPWHKRHSCPVVRVAGDVVNRWGGGRTMALEPSDQTDPRLLPPVVAGSLQPPRREWADIRARIAAVRRDPDALAA